MIKYNISYKTPHKHLIDFELITSTKNKEKLQFQLSAWRPGRYELADFAQNIINWQAYNEKDEKLSFNKKTKDLWEVECKNCDEIKIIFVRSVNFLIKSSTFILKSLSP